MNFSILKINDLILKGIQDAGYTEMTDIQQSTIPAALEHHDIVAQAPTGTGKTCAFIVPTLEQVDLTKHEVQILVICPTRELALQITDEYKKIGKHIAQLKILTIFGGQKIDRQLKELKKSPQIIVGTPGRILDHLERRSLNLTKVKMAVLDEADEMLDMGFIRDIDKILKVTNNERQTILLSATMPKPILDITKRYQKNPQ
jgi:ATP-dependent RNA helicase DeaD